MSGENCKSCAHCMELSTCVVDVATTETVTETVDGVETTRTVESIEPADVPAARCDLNDMQVFAPVPDECVHWEKSI